MGITAGNNARQVLVKHATLMKLNSMSRMMFAALCCATVLTACKRNNGAAANEPKITGSPSDAPVAIAPKWTAGLRYLMRLESSQSIQLPNFMGGGRGGAGGADAKNPPMQTSFAQDYALVVTNAADGLRGIELEILGLELVAARGDQELVNYDSRNKVAPQGGPMTGLFDQMIGGKIYYLLGADNKVVKVEGVQELIDRAEPPAGPAAANGGGMLRNIYTEDLFKQLVEMAGSPPVSVRVGESWTDVREANAPTLGTLVVTTTNTLRGWQEHAEKKCARVEFTGTVALSTNAAASPLGGLVKLQGGTVEGHYWFAPDPGLPIETVFTQNITITFPNFGGGQPRRANNGAGAAGGAGAAPDLSAPMHQSISLKLVETKPIGR